MSRLEQVSCKEVSPGVVVGIAIANPHCSAVSIFTRFDIYFGIANHPGVLQIDPMVTGCSQQHARGWLAAATGRLIVMRTIIDSCNRSPFGSEFPAQSFVNRFQFAQAQ